MTSDTLQKIFPLDDRPFAFVHHGENVLNGQPICHVLATLCRERAEVLSTASVRQMALIVAQDLDNMISATLVRIRDSKNCGFWVCGMEGPGRKPEMYEIIWEKESLTDINLRVTPHGDLLMGGDGAQFIREFLGQPVDERLSWQRIFHADLQYSRDLHDQLLRRAEYIQQQRGLDLFGGHTHQMALTPSGCEWIIPPVPTSAE